MNYLKASMIAEEERLARLAKRHNKYHKNQYQFWKKQVDKVIKAGEKAITVKDIYEKLKSEELREDSTPYGGKSFDGETYGDFIVENNIPMDMGLLDFNNILRECGLKKLKEGEIS